MLVDDLRGKQKPFVLAYLANGFNGTKAAREAGYKGSDATLAVVASENLRKPKIAAAIEELMSEMAMSAEEALMRLSLAARGDLGQFIGLTNEALKAHPLSHLLHTVKMDKDTGRVVEVRLYDAQAAQLAIIKQHQLAKGLPTDRIEVDWRSDVIRALKNGELTTDEVRDEIGDELAEEVFKSAGIRATPGGEDTAAEGTQGGGGPAAAPGVPESDGV